MKYSDIFSQIYFDLENRPDLGQVASYIPELKNVDPAMFGVHLTTVDNCEYSFGDSEVKFSIQSIAKVLSLTMAYTLEGENLWKRVGVEPSGTSFNSLVQLEHNKGIPRNPLINGGALVIADVLISHFENPKQELLNFIRLVSNNESIDFCERIQASEKETGFCNAALVNLMKSYGNIENDVEEVLDFYYNLCSIEMTCKELSRTFLYLANNGIVPATQQEIICPSMSKRINAIMQLCGFYDEAGEFSFKVGLPGKSGVGGGIIAIHPHKYSIAVWSPKLNLKGNSNKGIWFLESFTSALETSIF
ncbi:MAG: glutaminase [Flavobacteriaceae bacterium]|nr:glutaminase [Flavobacteriaceae bacterium]